MAQSLSSNEKIIEMQEERISEMKNDMNVLKEQYEVQRKSLGEREREIQLLRRRVEIFFNREFVAIVLGALLIIIFAFFLMNAMMNGIEASEVITNGFFVLLGFFFSQTARGLSGQKDTDQDKSPPPIQPAVVYQPTQSGRNTNQSVFTHIHDANHRDPGNKHVTVIDNEATNNNPRAILLVTQNWLNNTRIYNPEPIGVWYSTKLNKWTIFNQFDPNTESQNPPREMKDGAAFNVQVFNTATD